IERCATSTGKNIFCEARMMDVFHVMFWDTRVFINKKHQYLNNEILVHYLNLDTNKLEEYHDELRRGLRRILLAPEMSKDTAKRDYDRWVWDIQKILNKIDNIYLALPPYDACRDIRKDYTEQLVKCLNRHAIIFEDGAESDSFSTVPIYPDHNQYGYLTCDENGEELFWLNHFNPMPMITMWEAKADLDELQQDIDKANGDMQNTVVPYIRWLEDVLRVKYVYAKLLDEFYHIRHAFLNEHEAAAQFEEYLKTEHAAGKNYRRLGAAEPQAVSHEVFRPEDDKPILCDSYDFDGIGAFLYTDFFRGLKNNHVPKKCQNCGKWFLLPFGKYSDYCENPLADDPAKTCRDISARKKYEDKCKTDPIWLAYNRAYKAHYARCMKKKMSKADFGEWGLYAIELREKALAGELELAEYERLIKV
ncbi:MAG: DUF6076 domain-containing protein, partial [Clostridiales bacterium]|nr:DUF6076 domain-containing protein [Clostridiales bacterium]